MNTLFNITHERRLIMAALEAADGESSPELDEALAINRSDFEEKAENYGVVMRKLQTDTEAIDSEIKRLTALKNAKERQCAKLEERLLEALLLYGEEDEKGIRRIEAGTFRFSTRRNPKSVEILDENLVPEEFKVAKTTYTISKTTIKNALELGQEVPGAQFKDGDVKLSMR